MFKFLFAFWVGLMLASSSFALAGSIPPGDFRGVEFGAERETISGLVCVPAKAVKGKNMYAGVYYREQENLAFGQAVLHSVAYYFHEDRLRSVVVVIKGDSEAFLVKDQLIERYGEGRQVGGRYGWTWSDFSLVMERAANNDMSVLTYTYEPGE